MRTLLVITRQAQFSAALEATLDAGRFRLIHKDDVAASAALLSRGAVDCVVAEIEMPDVTGLRQVQEIRSLSPGCPLVVYASGQNPAWEEEVYLMGAAHILGKPARGRMLGALLDRLLDEAAPESSGQITPVAPQPVVPLPLPPGRGLETLRRFSSLLVHSLDGRQLIRDALQQLREALGVNRAAVFLRKPSALRSDGAPAMEEQWLRPAYMIGHEPGLIGELPLSLATGIGHHLYKHGRILRADHPEARANRQITKEFSALGSAIALPIHDGEVLLGTLVLDERLTGGGFGDDELAQLFHWLEEVGIALRNCWRHEQLSATHGLIDDILSGVGSGCVVVGANCGVLHINAVALRLLIPGRKPGSRVDFADIPQSIGSMIFLVLQRGENVPSFKWTPPGMPAVTCSVSIQPFIVGDSDRPNAALLVLDDISEAERATRLEMEAGKLRLIRAMAWHLAHEIGNAVTPVSTMQQLLDLQGDDPEVRAELSSALAGSVKRITRLTQQMNFLSREWDGKAGETVPLADLIEAAYAEANALTAGKKGGGLVLDRALVPWSVQGDPKALRHAFSELLLNALQANPDNPTVTVRVAEAGREGAAQVSVDVQDSGPGFPAEVADNIGEPFKSTRSVGLGLGLTVSRKIIESHRGEIEIPAADTSPGIVRVKLPVAPPLPNN